MSTLPDLYLEQPGQSVALDLTTTGLSASAIRALDWDRVFRERAELEAGGIANPDEGRQVGHYWLRAPERAPTMAQAAAIGEAVEAVRTFVAGVLDGSITAPDGSRYTDVLHIGIGGSDLRPAPAPFGAETRVATLRGLPSEAGASPHDDGDAESRKRTIFHHASSFSRGWISVAFSEPRAMSSVLPNARSAATKARTSGVRRLRSSIT